MTQRNLYTLFIPDDAQVSDSGQQKQQVSKLPVVSEGPATVDEVSSNPNKRMLTGFYRGEFGDRMAEELEELSSNQDISSVAFFGYDSATDSRVYVREDGYYATQRMSIQKSDPRGGDATQYRWKGAIVKEGARSSHWRAVETKPIQVSNEFGNDTKSYVAAPSNAEKVRWFKPSSKKREAAQSIETNTTAYDRDIDVYDTEDSSYEDPVLIYDLPYTDDGQVDVRVWDDHGESKTGTYSGDEVVQWQNVYSTSHDYAGKRWLDNGLLRVEVDEANNSLNPQSWDSNNDTWSDVSLGASDWELFDADITTIKMCAVRSHMEFRDTTQNPTAYFTLDAGIYRGKDKIQFVIPPDESGPVPSGLKDLLDPIAQQSVLDANADKGVIARKEVRK